MQPGLDVREVDHLASTRPLAREQRGLDGEGDVDAGVGVAVREAGREGGIAVAIASQVGVAAERVHGGREALESAVGAGGPEAGEARLDDARIELGEPRVVQPELLDDAHCVVLDVDVRDAHQIAQQPDAVGPFDVQRDALVIALRVVEVGVAVPEALARVAVRVERAEGALQVQLGQVAIVRARRVDVLDRLDLDHLGPEVGEDQARCRARPDDRLREHAHALEGQPRLAAGVGRGAGCSVRRHCAASGSRRPRGCSRAAP